MLYFYLILILILILILFYFILFYFILFLLYCIVFHFISFHFIYLFLFHFHFHFIFYCVYFSMTYYGILIPASHWKNTALWLVKIWKGKLQCFPWLVDHCVISSISQLFRTKLRANCALFENVPNIVGIIYAVLKFKDQQNELRMRASSLRSLARIASQKWATRAR